MKKKLAVILLIGLLVSVSSLPVMARSFSGMVINASIYGMTIRNKGDIRMFQIRPQTTGAKDPHPQDLVKVDYREEDGILVATHVKIVKRFMP